MPSETQHTWTSPLLHHLPKRGRKTGIVTRIGCMSSPLYPENIINGLAHGVSCLCVQTSSPRRMEVREGIWPCSSCTPKGSSALTKQDRDFKGYWSAVCSLTYRETNSSTRTCKDMLTSGQKAILLPFEMRFFPPLCVTSLDYCLYCSTCKVWYLLQQRKADSSGGFTNTSNTGCIPRSAW